MINEFYKICSYHRFFIWSINFERDPAFGVRQEVTLYPEMMVGMTLGGNARDLRFISHVDLKPLVFVTYSRHPRYHGRAKPGAIWAIQRQYLRGRCDGLI